MYVVGSKRREIRWGAFPDVALAQAREKARQTRQAIEDGRDPVAERATARSALITTRGLETTFDDEAVRKFLESKSSERITPRSRLAAGKKRQAALGALTHRAPGISLLERVHAASRLQSSRDLAAIALPAVFLGAIVTPDLPWCDWISYPVRPEGYEKRNLVEALQENMKSSKKSEEDV